MKKSDSQSRAIIMCGISGSGKTYHALRLVAEGYVRLSVDALVWQKVGTDINKLSKEEQKKLFDEAKDKVREQLLLHLNSGEKVVVDATHCRRSVRDRIRLDCESVNVKPLFIYCFAEEDELWRRLSKRKGSGPDDLIVTREELNNYWQGFERPQSDENDFLYLSPDNLKQ